MSVVQPPAGPAGRVATVQRQARASLSLAVVFAVAAAAAFLLPHRTGEWLPLHLFLVGALLLAISGATQLFAVTWAAGAPPSDRTAAVQRWCLVGGVILLALGREDRVPTVLTGAGGAAVILSLLVLASALMRIYRSRVQRRFDAAIQNYLAAILAGVAGCAIGVVMATATPGDTYGRLRSAHLVLNLLGLVGIVIVGTLPSFASTQLRTKMSPHATVHSQRVVLFGLVCAIAAAATGFLTGTLPLAAAGLALYAAGLVRVVTLLPRFGRKQLRWSGPRVLHLAAGIAWWFGVVAAAAYGAARGDGNPFTTARLLVLVVGGYAQILAGSLAYLLPVLRGGGHERLAAGFGTTRSWLGLVAANVAALAIAFGSGPVAVVAGAAWVVDIAVRAVLLRHRAAFLVTDKRIEN
jgi:nitrite reductase (NO-forming)